MKKMNKKGFTLIEMLVVVAIIAILVIIIVPTVAKQVNKAKLSADADNLRSKATEMISDYALNDKLTKKYTLDLGCTDEDESTIEIQAVINAQGDMVVYIENATGIVTVDSLRAQADGDADLTKVYATDKPAGDPVAK